MQKNKWLKIIITIISPIFSFLGITLFNMPVLVFIIIMFAGILYIIICCIKLYQIKIDIKNHSKKIIKILRKISNLKYEDTSNDVIEFYEGKYQSKRKQKEKLYEKRENVNRDLISATIIIFLFFIPRCKPINTMAKEIFDVVITSFVSYNESEETSNPSCNESEETSNPSYNESEEVSNPSYNESEETLNPSYSESEETWINFAIEYPDGYPQIDNKELEILYNRLFYNNEDNLNEKIKSKITIWLNSCKVNTPLENAVTVSGKSTKYYSDIEKGFTNEDGVLLSSAALDEVINGRKELFNSYPNGMLAWLLANHMQTYALNYLNQTNDEKSILYFYLQSIRYIQESLEFDMDNKDKYEQIRYLQSRYKDIAECNVINSDVRLRAYEIYISIDNVLNES